MTPNVSKFSLSIPLTLVALALFIGLGRFTVPTMAVTADWQPIYKAFAHLFEGALGAVWWRDPDAVNRRLAKIFFVALGLLELALVIISKMS